MEGFREDDLGYKCLERYGCGPMPPWGCRVKKKKKIIYLKCPIC
jgi:hypothetical protein